VGHRAHGADEGCPRACADGENGGLEVGCGGARVEYLGEMHKWVKIMG
jgi:hypothetical protein